MTDKFEAWGVIELMGHQRTAGRISEQMVGGSNLLRVDVPAGDTFRTVYYGSSAIYALHVTGEEEARKAASSMGTKPAFAYVLENQSPRISAAVMSQTDAFSDDEDNSY